MSSKIKSSSIEHVFGLGSPGGKYMKLCYSASEKPLIKYDTYDIYKLIETNLSWIKNKGDLNKILTIIDVLTNT